MRHRTIVVSCLGNNGRRTNHLIHLVVRQLFFCLRRVDKDDHALLSSLQKVSLLTKSMRRGDLGSLSESDGHDEDWIGYSRGRGESEREVAEDIDERLESTAKILG